MTALKPPGKVFVFLLLACSWVLVCVCVYMAPVNVCVHIRYAIAALHCKFIPPFEACELQWFRL